MGKLRPRKVWNGPSYTGTLALKHRTRCAAEGQDPPGSLRSPLLRNTLPVRSEHPPASAHSTAGSVLVIPRGPVRFSFLENGYPQSCVLPTQGGHFFLSCVARKVLSRSTTDAHQRAVAAHLQRRPQTQKSTEPAGSRPWNQENQNQLVAVDGKREPGFFF